LPDGWDAPGDAQYQDEDPLGASPLDGGGYERSLERRGEHGIRFDPFRVDPPGGDLGHRCDGPGGRLLAGDRRGSSRPVRHPMGGRPGGGPGRQLVRFTDGTAASAFSVNGSVVFPGAQAAILHWLKRKEPESLEKSRWALYCKDWLHLNLTGELCTDPSDASLPFFDIAKRAYDPHLLSLYGIEDLEHLLPPVRPATRVGGRLRKKVAEQMGLSPNTPVVSGPFDIPACSIGSGAIRDGEGYTILGSTCLSGLVMSRCYLEPRNVGMTLCHRDPDKWLRVMGVMMGTPNLDWFLSHLGGNLQSEAQKRKRSVFQQMEEAITKVPAGAGGVLYLPYLSPSGERAPFVKASARAQ